MLAFMIGGDRSGCGKTSITLALGALLAENHKVQTFKAGMDYIDPSYLTAATGRPCRNLDSFVMDAAQIRAIFAHACKGADIAIVEGVRGLYEGADAISDTGSSASIAKILGIPVVLVVNAASITRSAAAIVRGFASFDPDVAIRAVILNNVMGKRHAEKAVGAIEHFCEIPVIGTIPRSDEMVLTMRHLGLVPFLEGQGSGEFRKRIEGITGRIREHVSVGRLLSAASATPLPPDPRLFAGRETDVTVAVAQDEAFNFYYSDLFDLLPALGAGVVTFSPVHDRLPETDGIIIGGGYPELFLGQLEGNDPMREALAEVSRNGVPIYGECGGLMYLTDRIVLGKGWQGEPDEQSGEMCGVFSGETRMPARRVVSYVEGSCTGGPLGEGCFRGHEFHYSDVRLAGDTRYVYRLTRGVGISDSLDGAVVNETLGSYTHLHPVSSREMFSHFVERCRKNR
ncbi:MAG: Ni-sirohydrochlorin a,c-diamide synthase [Methanoregulaceae archaeon]|nr:Ni-sirohydrochlorin a,c-diamide synthase [Methanoregulaceae archaeon]